MRRKKSAAFLAAAAALLLLPGPNVALIVSNSIAHGRRFGLLTVAGTSSAMVLQLAVTVLGMSAMLATIASVFEYLRWAGVAYLLYLGLRLWFAPPEDLSAARPAPSARASYIRGLMVSLANPKTLLFFGAFLPQFASSAAPLPPQLVQLALSFLVLAVLFDSAWALLAARLRFLLVPRGQQRNRLAAGCYLCAGLGLALARKS